MVDYKGNIYTSVDTFFQDIRKSEPKNEKGVWENTEEILEHMCTLAQPDHGLWYIEPETPEDMRIDNWLLNADEIFHIHPELGVVSDFMESGQVIAEVWRGRCTLCGDEITGEYDMIHKFYKL